MTRETVINGVTLQAHDRWKVSQTPIILFRYRGEQRWRWQHRHKYFGDALLLAAGVAEDVQFASLKQAVAVVAAVYGVDPRRELTRDWYTVVGYHAQIIRHSSKHPATQWRLSCADPEYHAVPKVYSRINNTYWRTRADAVEAVLDVYR